MTIPGRFNGPPQSANGGFTCGLVAREIGANAAEVSLRRPPPLETPLEVRRAGARVELHGPDGLVAEGEPLAGLDAQPPRAIPPPLAARASQGYPWFEGHAFPTCFVCGPDRPEHDGLEIFTGPADGAEMFACTWTPAAEWEEGGQVRSEIVWAALDCPSAVPVAPVEFKRAPIVLARLAASLEGAVVAGREHVVTSWLISRDGRKSHSASVITDGEGAVLARARALWIELPDPAAASS